MSTLTYGMNMPTKRSSTGAPKAPKRTLISGFGDDSDEDNSPVVTQENQKPSSKSSKFSQYGDLSSARTSTLHSKTAESIDPSIYDYDGVYDAIHAAKKRKPAFSEEDDPSGAIKPKPRYINNLLAASKIRERDALRAKDRLLAKEREAEGDEFKDKEKFVTGAYKRQQEEMRKAEAEEAEREREAERRRGKGEGMKSFYKGMLERDEQHHQEVMRKVEEQGGEKAEGAEPTVEITEQQKQKNLVEESGAVVNEEGDVVDKRQLLGSGLNVGEGGMKASRSGPGQQPTNTGAARGVRIGRPHDSRAPEDGITGGGRKDESKKMEEEILAMLGS